MEFRKVIDIPKSELLIGYEDKLMLFGSCFAENIGSRLLANKFDVDVNPFGVLYNPLSIKQAIELLLDEREFSSNDLFFDKGLYHSFFHHSSFSTVSSGEMLRDINESCIKSSQQLRSANILLVTFGTSYVFREKETGSIVANCHKLPASHFDRFRLSVHEIVESWNELIVRLRQENPSVQILFTVSPIRHWKDGAHGNQLSKSILLLAIEELMQAHEGIFYFPSYELLLDELRDYRFYSEDMIHPNNMAVEYIWERFEETFFGDITLALIKEWAKISKAISHRPFNENTEEHKDFLRQTLLKLKNLRKKYPYFDSNLEEQSLEKRITSL